MELKKIARILNSLFYTGFGLIVLGYLLQQSFLTLPAIVLLIAMVLLDLRYWRCPHCGRHLGRGPAHYCPHCGQKLDL